jgi:hypothetical protein
MADAFRNHRIQLMGNGIELGDFDVAQRRLLEETRAGLALFDGCCRCRPGCV